MSRDLERARRLVASDPNLAAFKVQHTAGELQLNNGRGSFVRLIPTNRPDSWEMEFFIQDSRWRSRKFIGSLHECLELLSSDPNYLFWEG